MDNLLSMRYNQKFEGIYGKHLPEFSLIKNRIFEFVSDVKDSEDEFNGVHLEIIIDNYLNMQIKTAGEKQWVEEKFKTLILNHLLIFPSDKTQKVEYELREGSYFSNSTKDKIIGIYPIDNESFKPSTQNPLFLYKENIFTNVQNYDRYLQRKIKDFSRKFNF